MKKRSLWFFAVCLILTAPAFSQTAAEMEALLSTDTVSYQQAAWFVLRAADRAVSSPEEAYSQAAEQNWLPRNAGPAGRAVLEGVSLLIMQSFGLKGGFLYNLTKNPHYAYRELVFQDIIQGRADPTMTVSGEFLLFITGRVLSRVED